MAMAPKALTKVSMPDWKGDRPKPIWNISGKQEGHRARADAEQRVADDRGLEHWVFHQSQIEQRGRRAPRVAQIGDGGGDADQERRPAHCRRQRRHRDDREAEHDARCRQRCQEEALRVDPAGGGLSISGSALPASQMPASPIGTLMRNIQCQEMKVVMKPPTGGPTSGPNRPGW
jgi:hypothetical protein